MTRSREVNAKGRFNLYDAEGSYIGAGSPDKWEHLTIKGD
jgi:hypothetical protein